MIEIDGSYGEGGGQIVRTSITLSALTGKGIRIERIRQRRKLPGLKTQHQLSIQAAAAICGATVSGASLGSLTLTFEPGPLQAGNYSFDVTSLRASAGSTSLIFQTLLPLLCNTGGPSHLILKGGTDVPWSPPADYLRDIFLPTLAPIGIRAELAIPRRGFYPMGGGLLESRIAAAKSPLHPLRIENRGRLKSIRVVSAAANLRRSVAERQRDSAMECLKSYRFISEGEIEAVSSPGRGTFCMIVAEYEGVRAGFSAVGELGKPAEQVGEEAANAFLRYAKRSGALDPHLADQVVLYMALAEGESVVTVSEVTEHLRTNLWAVERFLPLRFRLTENKSGEATLRVKGAAFKQTEVG